MVIEKPIRASWGDFPDVLIFAEEGAVKRHPEYLAAKTGDVGAAKRLTADLIGAEVIGAAALTGKGYSAKLALSQQTLHALRGRYEKELESWWRQGFGHGFDKLTESEARYLLRAENAHTIRDRLAQARSEAKP